MNRSLRVALWVTATVVVAGAATATAVGFGGHEVKQTASATGLPPATTPVTRATLTQTQQVNGTLGYGKETTVTTRAQGMVTWVPDLGSTVLRGQPVCKVNNVALPLFYGDLPLYRTLKIGDSGDDVKELKENLAALEYTGFTVDTYYTSGTARAVKQWQTDLGLPASARTGTFDPATVVLTSGPMRVASLKANPGDAAGGPLLTYTGATKIVEISLDVSLQSLVKSGTAATVTLPDNKTVNGTVASVGAVATPGSNGNAATIAVTVGVADQSQLGTLDAAPVHVTLVSAHVDNVLTVPVVALVVLADGRYGVQVVTGSTSHYVAVKPGMFASGRVEISGEGIDAGTLVGIPA